MPASDSPPSNIDVDLGSSTPKPKHLPDRFIDLARRVEESDQTEPVYVGGYRVIGLLGAGGFGLVFLVLDESLDRPVALKLCPVQCPKAADFALLEARMLARFSHPNIVTVYGVGEHDGDVFYTMEFIHGQDGAALVHNWKDWRRVVSDYQAAAAALAAAHAQDVVHGDFKPANVLFGSDGRVRVADFGLAQVILQHGDADDESVSSHRNGTLPYMAPELLMGKPATPASDQWAFCVSLWETLYMRRPFSGDTVMALLDSIESGPPLTIGMVPRAVQAVLRKGLSIDPDDRYPNMHALIDALERVRSPMSAERPAKRRAWLGYALGVACGALLGVYGVSIRDRPVDPVPEQERSEPAPEAESVSPCVLDGRSPSKLPDPLVAACKLIRENQIRAAHESWTSARDARLDQINTLVRTEHADADALHAELAADSNIIVRTLQDQASRVAETQPNVAALAISYAGFWTTGAAYVTSQD